MNQLTKTITNMNSGVIIKTDIYEYENVNWEDQLTKFNNQIITYDNIGNPLIIGNNVEMGFINGRELNTYSDSSKGLNIEYKYNIDGIRINKVVNSIETKYYLENSNIIFQEKEGRLLYFVRDNENNLIGFKYDDNNYFYIKNMQNDIIGILDNNMTKVVEYEYSSWGEIANIIDNSTNNIGNINPFRYRSYYYDEETKLYYLNSRYYNPVWGRFLNPDIGVANVGELKGYNMYEYTFNNPINSYDSDGNWPNWLKKAAAAVAIVAVVTVVAAITVATAGTGTVAATIAVSAAKGAAIGMITGAVVGSSTAAISHRVITGKWKGAGQAALEGGSSAALSGSIVGTISGVVSSTIKVANAAKAWDSGGTYKSGYDSMTNHYQRQVIEKGFSNGNNVLKYTDDALNFANRNKNVLQFTNPSRSTMVPGFTSPYSSGNAGGWFTSEGKILTFWYK